MTAKYNSAYDNTCEVEPPRYMDINHTTRSQSSSASTPSGPSRSGVSTAGNSGSSGTTSNICRVFLIIFASFVVGCAIGGIIMYLWIGHTSYASVEVAALSEDSVQTRKCPKRECPTCSTRECPSYQIRECPTCPTFPAYPTPVASEESECKLVFKAVSEIVTSSQSDPSGFKRDPYLVWQRNSPYNEDIPQAKQLNNAYQDHYKSSFALNWEDKNIVEVKFALLGHNGEELIELLFDGEGSNHLNWFAKSRLLSTPWNDIGTNPQNFFSVIGDNGRAQRRWYINRNYGGCPRDNGWMGVITLHSPVCTFERRLIAAKPNFLYSLKRTYMSLNSYADVGEASILAIFVKTASP